MRLDYKEVELTLQIILGRIPLPIEVEYERYAK